MSDTRERIAAYVDRTPGVHFRGLVRALDLAPGQVQYHVRRLRRRGRLIAEPVDGRTHYFPPAYDERSRQAIAVLRRETARNALTHLVVNGPSRPGTVAEELDIARSTLEWHLDRMIEANLVEKRRDDRGHVTLVLADTELVVDLLEDVDPSLSERLVDRFTRLVDDAFGE
jgi:predicted transcriptional regulator